MRLLIGSEECEGDYSISDFTLKMEKVKKKVVNLEAERTNIGERVL